VRVRQPVRAPAGRSHDRGFLEGEDRTAGTGGDEHICNRLRSLRVRNSMRTALEDAEPRSLACGDVRRELGTSRRRRPYFEMRRARARERAGAEKSAAEVGAAATRA